MNLDVDLTTVIESKYPLPIAVVYRKLRKLREASAAAQIKQLLELFEITLKCLAGFAIRGYLVSGGTDESINSRLMEFRTPSGGHWLELLRESLKLYANKESEGVNSDGKNNVGGFLHELANCFFSDLADKRRNPGFEAALRIAESDPSLKMRITPNVLGLFDLLLKVRNLFAHGATKSESELTQMLSEMKIVIDELLKGLMFLTEYPLHYVREVKFDRGVFLHIADLAMGNHFDPVRLETEDEGLNSQEIYLFSLSSTVGGEPRIQWALSLSPYIVVSDCVECRTQQVFVFNKYAKKRIEFLSYGCGHEFVPNAHIKDFDEIHDFLEGKISLKDFFRGKTIGTDFQEEVIGVTAEAKAEARSMFQQAEERLKRRDFVLAAKDLEEAVRINPDFAEAQFDLALCHIINDRPTTEIVGQLARAIAVDPENVRFHLVNARILIELGRKTDAATSLRRALDADPTNNEARDLLNAISQLA